LEWPEARVGSDAGGLAGLAEALQLFATTTLAGLFVVASDGFLDRLAGTDP
jgi:hypothetical protein